MKCRMCGILLPGQLGLCDMCRYPEEGMKRCTRCLRVFPKTSEYFNSRYGKFVGHCKNCSGQYQKANERNDINKTQYIGDFDDCLRLLALAILAKAKADWQEWNMREIENMTIKRHFRVLKEFLADPKCLAAVCRGAKIKVSDYLKAVYNK